MRILAIRIVGGALAVVAMTLLALGGASAHTQVLSTSPDDGAHLLSAPEVVSATFDQTLLPAGNAMVVLDSDRHNVSIGAAKLRGSTISIGVRSPLPDGRYQVASRVISSDGHPIEASFTFIIGKPPASTPPVVRDVNEPGSGESRNGLIAIVIGTLAIGIVVIWLVARRVRRPVG